MLIRILKSFQIMNIFGLYGHTLRFLILGIFVLSFISGCSSETYRMTAQATMSATDAVKTIDKYCKGWSRGWSGDLSDIGADTSGFIFIKVTSTNDNGYVITYRGESVYLSYSDIVDITVLKQIDWWIIPMAFGLVDSTAGSGVYVTTADGEKYWFNPNPPDVLMSTLFPLYLSDSATGRAETFASALEFLKQQNQK